MAEDHRCGSRSESERGSGTVLVLALVIFTGFLMVVCLALANAILARHRVEAAADLVALAAAADLPGVGAAPGLGPGAAPGLGPGVAPGLGPGVAPGLGLAGTCPGAQRVAQANAVRLAQCRSLGDGSVLVGVQATTAGRGLLVLFGPARAQARAGVAGP